VTRIGLPNSGYGPSVINERGQVAFSQVYDEQLLARASLWDDGETTELAPDAPLVVLPSAINDRATIVGFRFDNYEGNTGRAFVWSDGALTLLENHDDQSFALDVNERDDVLVNRFAPATGRFRASVLVDGVELRSPDVLDGLSIEGAAINDRDQVVGDADRNPANGRVAYLWEPGHDPVALGGLGGTIQEASEINDRGTILGESTTAGDQATRLFLWRGGQMVDLGTLGGPSTRRQVLDSARSEQLNAHDQVTGASETAEGNFHAFRWSDGQMRDLGTLGGPYSFGAAINDHGDVVGVSATSSGSESAFLWRDGTMIDLGALVPDAQLSMAHRINNRGQVLGRALVGSDQLVMWETGNRG
jgi:probable HAF family extracellular repeat protein